MDTAQSSEQHPQASIDRAGCQDGGCSLHLWRATSHQHSSGWGSLPFQSWSQQRSLHWLCFPPRARREQTYTTTRTFQRPPSVCQLGSPQALGRSFPASQVWALVFPVHWGWRSWRPTGLAAVLSRGHPGRWLSGLWGGGLGVFPPLGLRPDSQLLNPGRTLLRFPEPRRFLSLPLGRATLGARAFAWRSPAGLSPRCRPARGFLAREGTAAWRPGAACEAGGPARPGTPARAAARLRPPRPGAAALPAPGGSGVPRRAPARWEERAAPCEQLAADSGPRGRQMGWETARGPAVSAASAPPRREPLLPAGVRLSLPGRGGTMASSEEDGGGNGAVEEKENGKKRRLGALATAWLIFYNVAMTAG